MSLREIVRLEKVQFIGVGVVRYHVVRFVDDKKGIAQLRRDNAAAMKLQRAHRRKLKRAKSPEELRRPFEI